MSEIKEQFLQALNKAYFYLKFRPRSKSEILNYLNKKAGRFKWAAEVIDLATRDLEEQGLVDDEKFVEWLVESQRSKVKSQKFLKNKLRQYGIEKGLIENYFAENPANEEASVRLALKKSWHRFSRLPKKERFQKAAAYLLRKGFNYSQIKKSIAEMEKEVT